MKALVWMLLAGVLGAPLQAQTLPEGRGRDIVQARCTACHDADLIAQQRLSRPGWGRSLDKMGGWGAVVPAEDRDVLLDYLAAHFAVTPVASHPAAAAGDAVYRRACLVCHEADLITQQRLSRAGWVRSVDKMIGWGAAVEASEKDALVDFLASRPAR